MPKRIQLSRKKGWRKPKDAIVVSRPSRWGNPFRVGDFGIPDRAAAVERYRQWLDGIVVGPPVPADFSVLRGRDLCCWCPLPEPGQPDHCHAAVLLEIANAAPTEESGER